jgi:hypothetical protein
MMDARAWWTGAIRWVDVNYPWLIILMTMILGMIVLAIKSRGTGG